ncbi:MAG TPA: hypothetical protein VL635_22405, partial [Trinickia sp.]|nr:hypothetical protein [Trinickia sp.]
MANNPYSSQVSKYHRPKVRRSTPTKNNKPREKLDDLANRSRIAEPNYDRRPKRRTALPPPSGRNTAMAKFLLAAVALNFFLDVSAATNMRQIPYTPGNRRKATAGQGMFGDAAEQVDERRPASAPSAASRQPLSRALGLAPDQPIDVVSEAGVLPKPAQTPESELGSSRVQRSADGHHEHDARHHHRRRGDAHRIHHPPAVDAAGYPIPHSMRNATIYPSEKLSEEMHSLINSVASFETLLAEPLGKFGYDPNEGLPFDVTYLGQQHHHGSTKVLTASEVVQHFTTSQRSGLHLMGQSPRATKLVQLINDEKYKENSDENFLTVEALNPLKKNHRKRMTNAILQKFEEFGIDGEDTVLLREVDYRKRAGDILGGAQHHTKSSLGAIIDIEKDGETQRYAIVPHHPDYVIRIPSNDKLWIQWMKHTGKALFFRNLDAIPSHARFATEVKPRSEDRRTRTVESAISHTVKPIVEKTIEHMTSLVTNDTPIEEAYHSILGLYIPYYDFGKSILKKDLKGAVLFLGFEFMPKVGSGVKQIVRGVFRGAR